MLTKEEGWTQRPIYYVSKALHEARLRYTVVEKSIFAIVLKEVGPLFLSSLSPCTLASAIGKLFAEYKHLGQDGKIGHAR